MSKKWNPFSRKKGSKVDSHGTTLANEEMIFQPTAWLGEEPQRRINTLTVAARNRGSFPGANHPNEEQKGIGSAANVRNIPQFNDVQRENIPDITKVENNGQSKLVTTNDANNFNHKQNSRMGLEKKTLDPARNKAFDPHPIVPVASISRTSPRVAKKLIKPGVVNSQQPSFLTSTTNTMGVSISDEYTDPFDAVHLNKTSRGQSTADGYIEPYEAQQMYHDATHPGVEEKNSADVSKKGLYDEPWDKTRQTPESHSDYEKPWDKTETLPYGTNRPHDLAVSSKEKILSSKHGELVMEYPAYTGSHSGESSTSSSSASLAKQRLVRVDSSPRHSPHDSPHESPKLDKRLIRPKESEFVSGSIDYRLQLCNVSKYKPVDRRLIKAEPSFGEIRKSPSINNAKSSSKNSSKANSPIGSGHTSTNSSPVSTLVANEALDRLSDDALRRASSPLVQPMNMSHYLMNKGKSRSLDIRNRQCLPNSRGASGGFIPKSASDDQLSHASVLNNLPPYTGTHALGGVTEYDEPWDGNHSQSGNPSIQSRPSIAHSRSKSYELSSSSANMYAGHGKLNSFNKPNSDLAKDMEYDKPWDQNEVVPKTHMESMQRFQHRQLELHPSEAISHRDFDPLIPLEKQSWFHGSITRDKANWRLGKELEGSYLVRISESVRNSYSLSLRTHDDTIHMVISRTRDGFWILGEFSTPFHSIPEMITFYAAHRLRINDAEHISLKFPLQEEYL